MSAGLLLRRAYVACVRALRVPLRAAGVLARLEATPTERATWLRSLFAIYDFEDMKRIGLPWWTFSSIRAVETYLAAAPRRVFEYGCGASTLWLAARSRQVVSIEPDPDWHAMVLGELAGRDNVELRLVAVQNTGRIGSQKDGFAGQYFDDFVAAIDAETEPFDVIVIDGRAREACLKAALPHLADGGIIVFDDTNRKRYRAAIDATGLPARRFDGRAVSLPLADSTTLIAKHPDAFSGL